MSDVIERLKHTFIYEILSPYVQWYEVYKWKRNGGIPPTPHLIKQEMVQKYAKRYKANIFVETGTYLGVMVDAVKNIFDKVYTIEIDNKLYERAKKKFAKNRNVTVLLGNSGEVLPKVLTKIKTPTLFWLDAHYSGGITARGEVETPILEELKQVLKYKEDKVILVDDANLFSGVGGHPTIKEMRDLVFAISKRFIIKNENNIIVISK